jgi:hypothetical protein
VNDDLAKTPPPDQPDPETTPPHGDRRGLSTPYIPGGRDPDPGSGRREERFYGGLLMLMVAAIILAGFAVTIIGLVTATPAR